MKMKMKIKETLGSQDSLMAASLASGALVFLGLAYAFGKVSEASPEGSTINAAFAGSSFMLAVAGPLLLVGALAVFSTQWRDR